jgi:hypothetical protein
LNTSICGSEPAPTSASTLLTCAMRSARFGSAASMTCTAARLASFLQRRTERSDQLVREVAHETDCVREEREARIGNASRRTVGSSVANN